MKRAEPEVCLAEPPTKRQRAIDAINALAQEHTRTCVATAVAYQLIKEIILRIIARSTASTPVSLFDIAPPMFGSLSMVMTTSGPAPRFGAPLTAVESPGPKSSRRTPIRTSDAPQAKPVEQPKPMFHIDYIAIISELVHIQWYEQFTSLKEIVLAQRDKSDDNYLTLVKRIGVQDSSLHVSAETLYLLRAICYCVINGVQSFLTMHGDDANQAIEAAVNFITEHRPRDQAEIMSMPIKQAGTQ